MRLAVSLPEPLPSDRPKVKSKTILRFVHFSISFCSDLLLLDDRIFMLLRLSPYVTVLLLRVSDKLILVV